MLFKSIFTLAVAASTAVAGETFHLRTIKPGSELHNGRISATKGGLLIEGLQQVDCAQGKKPSSATFERKGDQLLLYTGTRGRKPQSLFTDRSGMGRGVVGYLDHPSTLPENWETHGFRVDGNGFVTFSGSQFWACPSIQNTYALWLSQAFPECIPIKVQVEKVQRPVACTYKGGH